MKRFLVFRVSIAVLVALILVSCEYREDQVKSLEGRWKFSIGDDMAWAKTDFNDSEWDNIRVPDSWEDQGYEGYNGFAWYRKHLRIEKKYQDKPLYLNLGRVDDVDEVFFNGVLIGKSGSFPPIYESKYNDNRRYIIPKNIIKYGDDNVIAVRVYDNGHSGGIRHGVIGLFTKGELTLDIDLAGPWKFHLYDSIQWKDSQIDDSGWKSISVPSYFEDQGYENFDGFAWYRKKFDLPNTLINQKLVLILGKIDDIDQVYINGTLIGGIGTFKNSADSIETNDAHFEFRGYFLPQNIALKDSGNVIAVRIFDKKGRGGIYEGPVGLIKQENYADYWEKIKKDRW